MAENKKPAIQIGQMNMRIAGGNAESGRRMGNRVAESLSNTVPIGMHRHLGALSVRVQVAANATEAETGDAVAKAIMTALRK